MTKSNRKNDERNYKMVKIQASSIYGKKALSVSFSSNSKKTSIKHNERKAEDVKKLKNKGSHINAKLTNQNLVLMSKPIKKAYEEIFGDAVKEYNAKQKRADRRITDYYSKVYHDKSLDTQKEFIVQLGSKEDTLSDDPKKNREMHKQILKEYFNLFKETYPELEPYSAVVHVDEKGGPHLHMCVIPVATGYKRGMSKRPSFSKATGIKTPEQYKEFCENNRSLVLKAASEVLGAHIKRKKVGTHTYLAPEQYRELMHKASEEREKVEEARAEAEEFRDITIAQAKSAADSILSEAKKEVVTNQQVDAEVAAYREAKMSQVDSELLTEQSKVNDLKAEKTKLHNELLTQKKNNKTLTSQLTDLKTDVAKLQEENDDLKNENSELKDENTALEAQNGSLRDENTKLVEYLKKLKKSIEDAKMAFKEFMTSEKKKLTAWLHKASDTELKNRESERAKVDNALDEFSLEQGLDDLSSLEDGKGKQL